jgi:hypothetical protein
MSAGINRQIYCIAPVHTGIYVFILKTTAANRRIRAPEEYRRKGNIRSWCTVKTYVNINKTEISRNRHHELSAVVKKSPCMSSRTAKNRRARLLEHPKIASEQQTLLRHQKHLLTVRYVVGSKFVWFSLKKDRFSRYWAALNSTHATSAKHNKTRHTQTGLTQTPFVRIAHARFLEPASPRQRTV